MNIIFVGPLASGKTAIAEELIKRELVRESDYHSIEKARRKHSSGSYSGEMFAWANFLQSIEEPAANHHNIYEFSGTGRNVWNVSEAMRVTKAEGEKWVVFYVLAAKDALEERVKEKTYDAPCPYVFDNPAGSIDFMNKDLKKTLDDSRSWSGSPKVVVRTDLKNIDECVEQILTVINKLEE